MYSYSSLSQLKPVALDCIGWHWYRVTLDGGGLLSWSGKLSRRSQASREEGDQVGSAIYVYQGIPLAELSMNQTVMNERVFIKENRVKN